MGNRSAELGKAHRLQPVLSGDIRATAGSQPFVREAVAYAPPRGSAFTPPLTGITKSYAITCGGIFIS